MNDIFLFVVWNKGLPELDLVRAAIGERFTILKEFEVAWRPQDYIRNFAAFYGWKAWSMWLGKKRRSGTGPFRVIVVRDDHPKFGAISDSCRARVRRGEVEPDLMENENIYEVKLGLRRTMRHSNTVHASINAAETRQNVKALFGMTPEDLLARSSAVEVERFDVPEPLKYVPYKYAEEVGKGPQYCEFALKLNRFNLFLLPRCGVPTIFSMSFRLLSLFNFAFCLGNIKMGYRQGVK